MKKVEIVAIIDDDVIYQFTTKKIIESTNIAKSIMIFSEGKEAYDYISANASEAGKLPDTILLDLSMPVMDGFEFLENFRVLKPKLNKNIAVYVVSSSIHVNDINRVKNIPEVSDFIVRPLTAEKFRSNVCAIQ